MCKSKIIHPVIGEIIISQTRRARRISLSVRPPGIVRLSIPVNVPIKEAFRFAESKLKWIEDAKLRFESSQRDAVIEMPYSTRLHSLLLTPDCCSDIKVMVRGGRINVKYPLQLNYSDMQVQTAVKRGIEAAWRTEAKLILPEKLQSLANKHGFRYRSVTIRNTVSKWGSCSAKDDISLSIHLMRLPDHLIDYILLHELCHTVHKNHSSKFYDMLESHLESDHKSLNKELKRYNTRW